MARKNLCFWATCAAFLAAIPLWGQIEDDFSDGDFTQNPSWTGDADKFTIDNYPLDASNLMLRSSNEGAATYYLSTPNNLAVDTQWEYFVNPRFALSGANFFDVFLVADNADLTAVQNGYFLRYGRTQRDITFWKKTGGTDQLLIEGPPNQINSSSNNPVHTRVSRSQNGLWILETDQAGEGNFQTLGILTDADHTTTEAFGFRIVQSGAQGPINNHWFDEVSVSPLPPDVSPPEVVSAQALSSTEVLLVFNEPLDAASAGNAFNYFLGGGIGVPLSALFNTENLSEVTLTFSNPLEDGVFYNLTINGVEDLAGNTVDTQVVEVIFFTIAEAGPRDIVFNELMVDENPQVGLLAVEFIELYNTTTDKFFDLNGWIYVNGTTERTLGQAVLFPGAYLILCSTSDAPEMLPFGDVLGLESWPLLTNGADSLTLINTTGAVVDIVSYTDGWYQDTDKDDGGWTLEQINPFAPCSGMGNWRASEDLQGGTPGAVNSIFSDAPDTDPPFVTGFEQAQPDVIRVFFNEIMDGQSLADAQYILNQGIEVTGVVPQFDLMAVNLELSAPLEIGVTYTLTIDGPADCSGNVLASATAVEILFGEKPQLGDLIISEVMADPTPVVGLPAQEYFELFNASDKVLDVQGCDLSGRPFVFPRLLMPGEYLMCVSSSAVDDFQDFPDAYVMEGMSLTFLTNGGLELTLTNQDGALVNTVTYSDDWYADPAKADGGWSLEIINPFTECSGAQNWQASNAQLGGTPGAQNSVFDDSPDTEPPVLVAFTSPEPAVVHLLFSELMDVESLESGVYLMGDDIDVVGATALEPPTGVQLTLSAPLEVGVVYELLVIGLLDCSLNPLPETTIDIQIGVPPGLHDLLISEIMADPTPSNGLPSEEYFELYNASEQVIELLGCDFSGREFTRPRLVQPGEYVLCVGEAQRQEFFAFQNVYLIEDVSGTFLTNSGRELLLTNPSGDLVDRVNYDLSWYSDPAKEDGGWSLERINLDEPCRAGDNWAASVAQQGGTPQAENSVNSTEPDTTPPSPILVLVQSPTEVEVRFDEVIDSVTLSAEQFSIANIGVIGAEGMTPELQSIRIELGSALQPGTVYFLTIDGVRDCSGNPMAAPVVLEVALPEVGEPGDVIINEVLFNVSQGGSEFVEIYNPSQKAIGLQGWSIENQSGTTRLITEDPLVILPGKYMLFTGNPSWVAGQYPLSRPETFWEVGIPSLTNSAGSVIVRDNFQTVIDRFDYEEDFHLSLLRSVQGVSLERISFTRPTNDPGNWTSAAETVGFATPGYLNSQFRPDGRAEDRFELENEVFSPDNDGFQDVLLINYRLENSGYVATVQIYDRRGRLIRTVVNNQLIGTEGSITWDGTTDNRSKARIGPHIVYIELFDLEGKKEVFKLPCIVAGRLSN